jgi:hypothetical protein
MTKHRNKNLTKKITLLAGATVAALATQAHADITGDALINKLEQKGILSADEAKELRAENQQDFNNSMTNSLGKSYAKITDMPSWVTSYKISGDFRGRYEQFSTTDNDHYVNRTRYRYRLRFGIVANILDNMEVGFRLGSGDAAQGNSGQGNPVSQNSTMQNNWSDKNIYIDTAYAKWTAINSGDWLMAATIGKMDNPFHFTPMVFDPDLTPEGAAITGNYSINDRQNLGFTGAAFVMDEEGNSTRDPAMFGGQVLLNSKWTDKLSSSAGIGALLITSPAQLTAANVPYINQGSTRNAAGVLVHNYNPIIADANVTYLLDSFPLYNGAFPIKVGGEFIDNPAVSDNNTGYWVGVTFGKTGKKHTWDLNYRYEYLEADAWYDQMADDDNAVYYQTASPGGSVLSGLAGGTNVKGHRVQLDYSITDALTFTLTGYVTELVNGTVPGNVNEPNSTAVHVMADLMWKF